MVNNIIDSLMKACNDYPTRTALEYVHDHGVRLLTFSELQHEIEIGKKRLISLGAKPGDHKES